MKINIELLVATNVLTGEVINALPISSMYETVSVNYPGELVSDNDVIEWGKSVWGTNVYKNVAHYLDEKLEDGYFTLEGEAKDLPDLGDVVLRLKTVELDTKDFDL